MTDSDSPDGFTVHPEPEPDVERELQKAILIEHLRASFERMTQAQLEAVERALDSIHPWDDKETAVRKLREALEAAGEGDGGDLPPTPRPSA